MSKRDSRPIDTGRRQFCALAAVSALGTLPLQARSAEQPVISEQDPLAVAMGYKAHTTQVDKTKYPNHAPEQVCANCRYYQAAAEQKSGPCQIFGGKGVAAQGWCQVWAAKA